MATPRGVRRALALGLAAVAGVVAGAAGAEPAPDAPARCAEHDALRRPLFGDLHVHTALSLDASTQGTRNRPADAYRFARGEPLGIQPYDAAGAARRRVRLERPLDFAAVTDHAEMLGELHICGDPSLAGHGSWVCRMFRRWPRLAFYVMNTKATYFESPARFAFCGEGGRRCLAAARGPWREIQAAAEAAQDRGSACRFTTFVGYEWTGAPGSRNLHRNVLFRDARVPELPASRFEAPRPEDLWQRLRSECLEVGSGCDALVIPHNSNLSGGTMFRIETPDGASPSVETLRLRARLERLVELMQHKGDSECLPGLPVRDELCAFEKLPIDDFQGRYVPWLASPPEPASFVRHALEQGLRLEAALGVNPFRFGLVASTDTHLGTPGLVAEDERYPGHGGAGTPARERIPPGLPDALDLNPGGLAVLWAEENSREALFAALRRREAYGTSGPRLTVRFFGGWDYAADLCARPELARVGYARGVPMGGVLPTAPALGSGAPVFVVQALADPGTPRRPSVALQRIQIVKGWLEGEGVRRVVHDVAGDPDNGADVDLASCEPRGAGFATLCEVWRDPDFDPAAPAFYYARVVENPTCRWSQRLCNARGVACGDPATIGAGLEGCCAPEHRRTVQERAWTSPIWYAPAAPVRAPRVAP